MPTGGLVMEAKVRVLIVDDDRRMVKTISDILKIKGFTVLEAYTGEEALENVKRENPDCVLMDINMPGIGGVETLKLIRDASPDLPVVLMSAYATDEMETKAREQGAYAVLTKPIDFQMVLSFLSLLRKEQSILIVDDDPAFCRALTDVLQNRGYRVETEMNPDKVLGHFEERYQLVVLLDLKLGNTKGIDVLKAIRARYPTKPVLLVTGGKEDMAGSIEQGLRIGAYTCIYKPLETETLFSLIREISRKKIGKVLEEEH